MTSNKSSIYQTAAAAEAFAAFSANASGEKALIWSYLRRAFVGPWAGGPVRILDFGCGTGWLARQTVREFAASAVGYDPSPAMISQARGPGDDGAHFTNELAEVRARSPFDLAFMVFVTPAVATKDDLRQLFFDSAPLLAPHGRLLVAAANPDGVFGRHSFFESRRPGPEPMTSGSLYETDILDAKGDRLITVNDAYWKPKDIVNAAQPAGLRLMIDCRLGDPMSTRGSRRFPYRVWEFARKLQAARF